MEESKKDAVGKITMFDLPDVPTNLELGHGFREHVKEFLRHVSYPSTAQERYASIIIRWTVAKMAGLRLNEIGQMIEDDGTVQHRMD